MDYPHYRKALQKQGVEITYVEKISLEDIDFKKSQNNQARLTTPVVEELVNQYAQDYKDGDEFPPLVLARVGKGRWVIVDGNNRFAALTKLGRKFTDAYLLSTSDEAVINRITWTFNDKVNGLRNAHEDRLFHATTLVQKYGMEIKTAARECGVHTTTLANHLRAVEIRSILEEGGLKSASLGLEQIRTISILQQVGNDVLVKGAEVVINNGLTIKDTEELIRTVKRKNTVPDKLKAIEEFAESDLAKIRKAETKGGKIKPKYNPRLEYEKLLKKLEDLHADYAPAVLRPTGPAFKLLREVARNNRDKLTQIFSLGAINPPNEEAS